MKHGNKDDIQHRINKAAGSDDHSRPARVAHGAQQCRSHIEQQRRNHGGKIATSIGHALGQKFMRSVHKHQHGLNEHCAKNRENDAAHQRERHGRMDRTAQSLIIVLTKILTGNDRAAGADANAKANAELGEHHRGLDATQCELAAKLADDIRTDKRVSLLKKRTKKDGNAQRKQLLPNNTLRYIDSRRFLSHTPSPKAYVNRQNSN